MYLHRASWHSSATLTEVFPCFFLICKANVRVKTGKMGHGPHSFKIVFVLFFVLFTFVLFYVLFVFVSFRVLFVCNVYCTAATGWLPNCS